MKKRKSKILIISAIIVALIATAAIVLLYGKGRVYGIDEEPKLIYDVPTPYNMPVSDYQSLLNDVQDVQILSATRLGIEPMETADSIGILLDNGRLVKVPCSKYLVVKAKYPYLIPEAYDLLLEIARRYQEKAGGNPHLRVTSCLRTMKYVDELRKDNPNSVKNSCHLYGTTFDISYAYMSARQKEACAQVLKEMRDAGYLHAKYETEQPCFHVTLRRPGASPSGE